VTIDNETESASPDPIFTRARRKFHSDLIEGGMISVSGSIPSIADKGNRTSIAVAHRLFSLLGLRGDSSRLVAQKSGSGFETAVTDYLAHTFPKLDMLRPGKYLITKSKSTLPISKSYQYKHLELLDILSAKNPELAAAIGTGYIIKPDIIIFRQPEDDAFINRRASTEVANDLNSTEASRDALVDKTTANLTGIRASNNFEPILHASISCKFTIRSDRVQNSRSEALNLIRNRKGRQPHIAVVTAEPLPSRIASIALGTGDVDCTYHIALPELLQTVEQLNLPDALDSLQQMVEGRRLKDISDLPFDLTV
jgi:hypothetical protein